MIEASTSLDWFCDFIIKSCISTTYLLPIWLFKINESMSQLIEVVVNLRRTGKSSTPDTLYINQNFPPHYFLLGDYRIYLSGKIHLIYLSRRRKTFIRSLATNNYFHPYNAFASIFSPSTHWERSIKEFFLSCTQPHWKSFLLNFKV